KNPLKSKEEVDLTKIYHQIYESAASFYQQQLRTKEGERALAYLKGRGLSEKLIERARLGYAPLNSQTTYKYLAQTFKPLDIVNSCVLGRSDGTSNTTIYNQMRGRV